MGLILDQIEQRTLEDPTTPLTAAELMTYLSSSVTAKAGVTVNTTSAMRVSAVFACVRLLAETIASLPLITYERLPSRGKKRAQDHALYSVLHDLPNPYMTAMELRENLVGHLCLWGNAYAEVIRDTGGRVREIWPLRPDRVTISTVAARVWAIYTDSSGEAFPPIPYENLWHIRAFGTGRYSGLSVISQAREAIGLGLATEEYGSTFFANNAQPSGILRMQGRLKTKDARDNLKTSWESAHKGLDYAHRVAVLEEGIEWQQIGMPNEDAQFLGTRKYQLEDIARMFRVQPHKIGVMEHATFGNIEHQAIEFVVDTIRPWLVRFEQSIYRDLLTPGERARFFVEHLIDGLLRGDIANRYQAYAVARQNGWMSANDIRELENMNPIEDGDIYLVPLNMVPASQAGAYSALPAPEQRMIRSGRSGSAAGRRLIARSFRKLISAAAGRVLRREETDVMRKAEKMLVAGDSAGFLRWLEQFYVEHREFFGKNMLPVFTALADQIQDNAAGELDLEGEMTPELDLFLGKYTDTAALQYTGSNFGQLRQVMEQVDEPDDMTALAAALQARFAEWDEKTPGKVAMRHSVRCSNAVTRESWFGNGVRRLTWVAHGESCAYCNALNGRTVAIYESFLKTGEDFQPEGAETVLRPTSNIGHAPAHDGCDCGIAPG